MTTPVVRASRKRFNEKMNVERSVILCSADTFWIDEAWLSSQSAPRPVSSDPLKQNLQNYEKELIEAALGESNEKVAGPNGAAAKLGIPRSTLDLKSKQLNMNNIPFGKSLVELPVFWHFLRFCHSNFISSPVFSEIQSGTRFALPVIDVRMEGMQCGRVATAMWLIDDF